MTQDIPYIEAEHLQLEDHLLTDYITQDLHFFIKKINDRIRELRRLKAPKEEIEVFKALRKKYFTFYNQARLDKTTEEQVNEMHLEMNLDIQTVG